MENRSSGAAPFIIRLRDLFGSVRRNRLSYMLIFALAPVFANMQNDVLAEMPTMVGVDAMTLMGAAYCMGAAL
ncbi:MAG: hypothetical protein GX810_03530 [Clostridiales bacterium]|nr:hypothetical protein [Clostridiales bacterium]